VGVILAQHLAKDDQRFFVKLIGLVEIALVFVPVYATPSIEADDARIHPPTHHHRTRE
jgi:hypothetical protein